MSETGRNRQTTEGDENSSINFRPSPNFKNMRKYLKYKFENAGTREINNENVEESRRSRAHELDKKLKVAVQPPLPPNSPPPDCPANFILKKEIEDDGYENNSLVKSEEVENEPKLEFDKKKAMDEKPPETTKKTMCKDFIRGICKRGDACIYAHEVDLNQLSGVYKFCRDFENRKCKRPVCFFVHATTSEKEHFFRTAELPEHTLSHLRDTNVMGGHQMSQAPMPVGIQPVYLNGNNQPPNPNTLGSELPRPSEAPPLPVVPTTSAAVGVVDPRMPEIFQTTQPVSPTRRDWPEFSGGVVSCTDTPASAPKTCLSCQLKEITFMKNKAHLEDIEKSLKKWKETAAAVEQKRAQLMSLLTLMVIKNLSKNNLFQNICD